MALRVLLVVVAAWGVTSCQHANVDDTGPSPRWTLELPGDERLELVLVPAASFAMGSPETEEGRDADEPQHGVEISRPFYLGKYEVTQGQWAAVMGSNPSFYQFGDEYPVERVTWANASAFCERLTTLVGRPVRLPTEGEWELACRAGTSTPWSCGTSLEASDANHDWTHDGATGEEHPEATQPVGSYAANAFGLHDMHGNVREWCRDWYGAYDTSAPITVDPAGPASGDIHVLRGGSWDDYASRCRSAARLGHRPGDRDECNGLRICVPID